MIRTTHRPTHIGHWGLFVLICLIWGSSFILMKQGMVVLSATEVASIRMLSAGLVLLPIAWRHFRKLPREKRGWVLVSGWLGSFIPAFLFCMAEQRIDSSLAAFLNALTPIFTLLAGYLLYKTRVPLRSLLGVTIGFAGMLILFWGEGRNNHAQLLYAFLVVLATVSYGINLNLVARHLQQVPSLRITAIACSGLIIPSLLALYFSGFFNHLSLRGEFFQSVSASLALGLAGTAGATVLYYSLLKKAGALFTSMVTYGIPFVALGWGLLAGESIGIWQLSGLFVVLGGVFLANK